tara:strand:+ start:867 stop:2204 length:1338 start_codon:yes stop_codon:yes gene_type:complete
VEQEIDVVIEARPAFRKFLNSDLRWFVLVAHRRAGKTVAAVQKIFKEALTHSRDGPRLRFGYVAPTRTQAKDIAWQYIVEYATQIPGTDINIGELRVSLPNGAEIRLYSGENYERMRGIYMDGVICDEDADIPPAAFEYVILPCLMDYDGWHVRMGTPKGKNAFYEALKTGEEDPSVFTTVIKASESGILSSDKLETIRAKIGDDAYAQEMECDFNVGRPGAIYSADIEVARKSGRILPFPVDQACPVYTTWDLGSPANTVVCYWQRVGFTYRLIDCDHHLVNEDGTPMKTGQRVSHMMGKGYHFASHLLPHDSRNIQYDAMSMLTKLREAGLANVRAIPRGPHGAEEKRVQTMNDLLPSIFFNEENLNDKGGLIEALDNYHRAESKKDGWISNKIVHDWSSHFADAFGYFGEALRNNLIQAGPDAAMPTVKIRSSAVPRNSPSR